MSVRYAIPGMVALAALSVVHWLRDTGHMRGALPDYLLGVSPNLCAAVAITFVVLSAWADQQTLIDYRAARRWFSVSATIAGVGLLAWEVVQRSSARFVFDVHDIGATLAGLALSAAVFRVLTPRPQTSRSAG